MLLKHQPVALKPPLGTTSKKKVLEFLVAGTSLKRFSYSGCLESLTRYSPILDFWLTDLFGLSLLSNFTIDLYLTAISSKRAKPLASSSFANRESKKSCE